jgi:hypothetical protein
MVEIQQSRDTCIDILSSKTGESLTIMSNLKSADQVLKTMEGYLCRYLGSDFGIGEVEELLRCSVGFNARGREGIEEIGKAPEYNMGWQAREVDLS